MRGRAIPFHFSTYSSRTIEDLPSSRNLELLRSLVDEGVHFVIRLRTGAHAPLFYYDAEQKRQLKLLVAPIDRPSFYRQVYYMGEVCLNVVGIWRYGFKEPMWIMTNMEPEVGLALYYKRMKIEICFRDLKSLLHIDKVMNKSQEYLDKMLAMVMLTYAVCLVVGEAIRDVQYAGVAPSDQSLLKVPEVDKSSCWFLFSGPFSLLKQRYGWTKLS